MKFRNYIILFILINTTILFAQDGSLDNTFSDDGIVTTPIGNSDDIGYSVAVQSDGKIVVAGASQDPTGQYDFAVVRYNDDGSLDNSFATDGKTTTDIKGEGATDYGYSVAVQKDNKIVVAGWTFANSDFAVARYNNNGTLDDTFGSGGRITTSIGTTDKGQAVAIQDDGRIVVAGYSYGGDTYDFAVVRYDTNGVLDDTFNSDGKVTTDFSSDRDYGMGVAIQPDNKIIVVGGAKNGTENKLGVVRYNNNGSLDANFGTNGKVLTSVGGAFSGNSALVAVQSDDKIVVTCTYSSNEGYYKIAVVRYNPDGTLDSDFGNNGIVLTSISDSDDEVYSLKLQDDDKILVGGYATSSVGHDFALLRYNSDGTLDSTFDSDGIVTTHLTSEWSFDDAYGMAIKKDKIMLCGRTDNGNNYDFGVAQYNNDGTVSVESNLLSTQNLEFNLSQNYPNPFNPSTTIKYSISAAIGNGHAPSVQLKVYNILGQEVATLVNKQQQPGQYKIQFDASSLPSGTYFYRLTAGNFSGTKKLLLLK